MSEARITIMVSTVDGRALNNALLCNMKLHKQLRMLIVNQKINTQKNLVIDNPFCEVINTSSKGLARSRNLGLSNITTGFIVIADDDVTYLENFDNRIREAIQDNTAQIFTFRIETPEGNFYKKYSDFSFTHDWRSILKTSSIEIVANVETLKCNSIYFDEDFGLGSKYSTGEENIFLNDALKKGLTIKSIPESIVVHPAISSGSILNDHLFYSKGAMFKRLYGLKGLLFVTVFSIKKNKLTDILGVLRSLRQGLKGFMSYQMRQKTELSST